ncbi:MAG: hypothetical protein ACRCZ9_12225 [Fusobacteriaceae bacterium]
MEFLKTAYLNSETTEGSNLLSEAVEIRTLENITPKRSEVMLDRGVSVQKFNSIILPYNSIGDSVSVISRLYKDQTRLTLRSFESYHTPRMLRRKIGSININERYDDRKVYKDIMTAFPEIRYCHRVPTMYQHKNLFLDLATITESIFSRARKTKADVTKDIVSAIIDIIDDTISLNYTRNIVWDLGVSPIQFRSYASILESSFKTRQDFMSYLLIELRHNGFESTLRALKGKYDKNMILIFTSSRGVIKLNVDEMLAIIDEDSKKGRVVNHLQKLMMKLNMLSETIDLEDIKNNKDIDEETKLEILKELELDIVENNAIVEKLEGVVSSNVDANDTFDSDMVVIKDVKKNMKIKNMKTTKMDKTESEKMNDVIITQMTKSTLQEIRKARTDKLNRGETPRSKNARARMLDKFFDILDDDANQEYLDAITLESTVYDNVTCLDNINENKFVNFDTQYDEKLRDRDIIRYVSQFAESDTPLFLESVKKKNGSNAMNIVDTYQFTFSDDVGKRHTFTINIPRLVDGVYFYLNGSKKTMKKQLSGKPITRLGATVRINTNYNKVFMDNAGGKYPTPYSSVLGRVLESGAIDTDLIEYGNVSKQILIDGKAPLEFSLISKYIKLIKFKDLSINFSKFETDKDGIADIGIYKGETLYFNTITDKCYTGKKYKDGDAMDLSKLILDIMSDNLEQFATVRDNIKSLPKNYASSHIMILGKHIPTIFVLMYTDGLIHIMDLAGVEYKIIHKEFNNEKTKKPKIDKYSQGVIELEDAYIIYEYTSADIISLMNPVDKIDLTHLSLLDIEDKDAMSVMLADQSGSNNFPVYIDNYRTLFIDPETKEVLMDHGQPTSFPGVFIYANSLLATGPAIKDISMTGNRIRSSDIITSVMYDVLAQEFGDYSVKKKRGAKNNKFSVAKNSVSNALTMLPSVEEYSVLNPILERDKTATCSFQGHMGINVSEAYTIDKRMFDETFYGIVGVPSAYGASIGIAKHLTVEPKINSLRGYVDITPTDVELEPKNVFSITEMLTPFVGTHDDPPRNAMNMQQAIAVYGVRGGDVSPVTYGYDEVIPNQSADFVRKAKMDGVILALDGDFMSVKYSDGTTDVLPLKTIEKNSAKSAFIDNSMDVMPKFRKIGSKFNKGDIIAYNKYFYKTDGDKVIFTQGPVVNVGLITCPEIYEDSTLISETMSQKMTSVKIKNKQILFTKDCKVLSGITELVNVRAGDTLIKIIKSTGDTVIDQTDELDKLGMDLSDINTLEKTSDRMGDIVGIRVYHCFDLSKASNSVQKFVKSVKDNLTTKHGADQIEKFASQDAKTLFDILPIKVAEGDKINGRKIYKDQIIVEYMLSIVDKMSRGDKMAFHCALKGIVGRTVPDEDMPVGIESGIRCDVLLSVLSPLARMTMSPFISGITNRIIDFTGDKVLSILGIKDEKK